MTIEIMKGNDNPVADFFSSSNTPETDACKSATRGESIFDLCERMERERDEAREQIKELIYIASRAISLAEIDFENDKFGIVSELRDGLGRIKGGAK